MCAADMMPVAILDAMQVLDQQIAAARRVAEQRLHLGQRLRIDGAALRTGPRALRPDAQGPTCRSPSALAR